MANKTQQRRKRPTKIVNGEVTKVSLVHRAAHRMRAVYKSADASIGDLNFELLVAKSEPETGLLTAVVYPPDSIDLHNEWAEPEEIRKMAHSWLRNGAELDIEHDGETLGQEDAYAVESFVIQKGDPRFAGMTPDPAGGWGAVIQLVNPNLRDLARTGVLGGLSMGGKAQRVTAEPPTAAILKSEPKKTMDETQLKALLDAQTKALVEGFSAVLKSANLAPAPVAPAPAAAATPTEPANAPVIEFEGDPFEPTDVAKHADKVALSRCNLSTADGLAQWQKYLAGRKPAVAKSGASIQPAGSPASGLTDEQRGLARANAALGYLNHAHAPAAQAKS